MAYQNVGTPRFYINHIEYLVSNGIIPSVTCCAATDVIFKTLPVTPTPTGDYTFYGADVFTGKSFIAVFAPTPFIPSISSEASPIIALRMGKLSGCIP